MSQQVTTFSASLQGGDVSDTQQGDDWWMATDGKWYPPSSHPSAWESRGVAAPVGAPAAPDAPVNPAAPAAPSASVPSTSLPEPPGLDATPWMEGGSSSTLTSWVIGVAAVTIALFLGGAIVAARTIVLMNNVFAASGGPRYEEPAREAWLDGEELLFTAQGVTVLSWILFTVFLIAWLYRAYSAVERSGVAGRTWSRGWAIGGFFIPVGNLFIPFMVASEAAKIAQAHREPSRLASWRLLPPKGSIEPPWDRWRLQTLEARMELCHTRCHQGSRPRVGTARPRRSGLCVRSVSCARSWALTMGR